MVPKGKNACPLSPALVHLLQACVEIRSTHDKALAARLCLSPETVRTEFKRIGQALGTHDRFASVLIAWENGWIVLLPPPPQLKVRIQKSHSRVCENVLN